MHGVCAPPPRAGGSGRVASPPHGREIRVPEWGLEGGSVRRQPTGFIVVGQEGKVLRLRKALYGLRQAPRAWNSKLDNTLKKMNFI
jgi:hypothetical protein